MLIDRGRTKTHSDVNDTLLLVILLRKVNHLLWTFVSMPEKNNSPI